MQRTIEQWAKCDPRRMATSMSKGAVYYALSDAKADIIELHGKLSKKDKLTAELINMVLNLNPTSGELGEGYCRNMQQLAEEIAQNVE